MLISITKFELCVKCSAHSETPGRRDDAVYFPHQSCLSLWGGGNLPYHERADKDTARLPHRFPHVTGPTLHLPYLPHFTGCLQSAVSHCVCSCRSCHLDQIQLHADFISSRVVVCAVKLFITLGSQLYRTHFLFYVDSSKPIRVS